MKYNFQKITFAYIIFAFTIFGCRDDVKKREKSKANSTIDTGAKAAKNTGINTKELKHRTAVTYHSNFLATKDVLINGHAVILSYRKFNSLYRKIDSSRTALWECGDPFEWLDAAWMKKTYGNKDKEKGTFEKYDSKVTSLYVNDMRFDTNKHMVLFNTASATSNTLEIPSHHIVLNNHTSVADFKKMFPNVKLDQLENSETVARCYLEKDADDAFLFYFKNGKLNYFSLWWLLC